MVFPTAEGFYDYKNNEYIYQYKDHLGNVRVSYKNNNGYPEITDQNDFYPFGMNIPREEKSIVGAGNLYNYKYNGKELQETGMYDYGARMYMPDIGRWGVVDPLAEKYSSYSPYNYVLNNPIKYIDPDGRWVKGAGFWNNITKSDARIHAENFAEKLGSGNYNVSVNKGNNGYWKVNSHTLNASYTDSFNKNGYKNTLIIPYSEGGGLGTAPSVSDPWGTSISSIPESRGKTKIQMLVAENPLVQGVVIGLLTDGIGNALLKSSEVQTVYRVFGGDSRAQGYSWTTVNPTEVSNFRNVAGLPSGGASGATNTAEFMIQGTVKTSNIMKVRSALPLDGNVGGLSEYIINPANVKLNNFSVLKP